MLTASADYISAVAAADRQVRAYLRFNNTTNLRGYDGLISIDWYSNLFDEERPSFGCAVASYIEAKFYNNNISGISYETSYVDAYIGVVTKDTGTAPSGSIEPDTATVEYMNLGRFYISEVETDENIVTITAYDVMSKLSKNYVPTVTRSSNGYAIKDICNDIFSQCGTGFTPLTNNYGYVDTVYEGTCREQLGWMCSLMYNNGDTFVASRQVTTGPAHRSLVDSWGDYSNYTITDNVIYEGGIDIKPNFTINSITSGTADNPIVAGNGVGLERENPNITQAKVTTIYNNLNGKTWTPMTIEFRGDPRLMVGDVVKVTHKGTNYRCYIQHMHTIFNGGMSATIECYGDSEATYQMSTAPTAARIQSVQTEVADIIRSINAGSAGYCTKIFDANGNWTQFLITNQMDYTQATSVWKFDIDGLSHSTSYSGGTYSFALDDQGRIVANRILVGRIQGTGSASYWDFDNDEINLTGSFTMTGGSINITTSSLSQDVIKLTYGSSSSIMRSQGFEVASVGLSPYSKSTMTYSGLTITDNGTTSASIAPSKIWVGTHSGSTLNNVISLDYSSGIKWQKSSSEDYLTVSKDGHDAVTLTLHGYGSNTTGARITYSGAVFQDSASTTRISLGQNGLTFYDSNGNETYTYPATGLTIGTVDLTGNEQHGYASTGTRTITLATGTYLITSARYNNANATQDGVWVASVYSGGTSHMTALLAPTGGTTASISGGTLTLTTGSVNVRITITKLS